MKFFYLVVVVAISSSAAFAQTPEYPSAPSSSRQPETPPAPPNPPATAPKPSPTSPAPVIPAQIAPARPATPSPQPTVASNDESLKVTKITKSVDEVNVIFTVTDKHKRFVKDLTKADFTVLDDKKPVQVRAFVAETDLPLRVGLLIDASNSIRDRFQFEQASAIEFLNQIVRPGRDQAFVLGFDSEKEITQDYTDSTEKLAHGVRMLRPGGGTALFDAIYFACRDKLLNIQTDETVRRAIIVVSDGEDNQSRVTREEAIEMAQRAEVIVYSISTNISGSMASGDKVMRRISEATGGRVFFPFKIQDVADAFSEIQQELRSQYVVSYKPEDFRRDGKFRSIDIIAQARKLTVRSRRGYYAPRQ